MKIGPYSPDPLTEFAGFEVHFALPVKTAFEERARIFPLFARVRTLERHAKAHRVIDLPMAKKERKKDEMESKESWMKNFDGTKDLPRDCGDELDAFLSSEYSPKSRRN